MEVLVVLGLGHSNRVALSQRSHHRYLDLLSYIPHLYGNNWVKQPTRPEIG